MLKTLKWVYGLGVKQERQRIAAGLQLQQQRARTFNEAALVMIRDPASKKEVAQKRRQRLELQMAVNDRIQEIVNEMFRTEGGEWINANSIMFPDEGKKK
jgi:hypothetical protein